MEQNQNQCLLEYIGEVRNKINLAEEMPIMGVKSKIILKKEYTTGLLGLDGYSHIIVIGLLNQLHESKQEGLLIRSKNKDVFPDQGIFALRGRRINSISFNACKLIDISHGIITVDNLDLITNTLKILSRNIKRNPRETPIARLLPVPPLLLKEETEIAINVKIKQERGIVYLLWRTKRWELIKGEPAFFSYRISSFNSKKFKVSAT